MIEMYKSSAVFSKCNKYRYSLTRVWNKSKPKIMFLMLNPSTADEVNDDPTIRRCIDFAKTWGFGGLYVCNLFAFRSTDPKGLLEINDPFGEQNLTYIRKLANKVDTIICAWGNKPILEKILKNKTPYDILNIDILKLNYLELSKDEIPKHPLYLRKNISYTQFKNIK
jgi:hypothetical protein